jgi:hypothetical protein
MNKLQELMTQFENYLGKVFPDFLAIHPTSLQPLIDLQDRIDKHMPIISYQTVDDSVEECLLQIRKVTSETNFDELRTVLENCKNISLFKQKIAQTNLKSFLKYLSIYQVRLHCLRHAKSKDS